LRSIDGLGYRGGAATGERMADLALELEHLSEANRHIAEAEARINAVAQRLNDRHGSGSEIQARDLLRTMQTTLDAFHQHRALLLSVIRDLETGVQP
jgi:hypothetical protein